MNPKTPRLGRCRMRDALARERPWAGVVVDRWSLLAGIRFVLATVVAFNHLADYAGSGLLAVIPKFGAFEAILGFLLISGYSVSGSYLREPGGYFMRRVKRIYPIYVGSIVLAIGVGLLGSQGAPSAIYTLFNLLLLNQLATSTSLIGPAWTLSLEFWLYTLAPSLIRLTSSWTRAACYLSFVSYLAYTACRSAFHLPYYSNVAYGANLLFLSFPWICGLRLAKAGPDQRTALFDLCVMFSGHIVEAAGIQCASRIRHHAFGAFLSLDAPGLAMQAVLLASVYLAFAGPVLNPSRPGRKSPALRFLGDVSYPLYLTHLPVYMLLARWGLKSALGLYAAALAVAAGLYWSIDSYSKRRHLPRGAA